MNNMKILHLNLKGEYFDAIKSGEKAMEFRRVNDFWKKKLLGREYDKILIKRGYPKKDDKDKIIERPWRGFTVHPIDHKNIGPEHVNVFCFSVN